MLDANLVGITPSQTNPIGAYLAEVGLREIVLRGADVDEVNLACAAMRKPPPFMDSLFVVHLTSTNLTGVIVNMINLEEADLTNTKQPSPFNTIEETLLRSK